MTIFRHENMMASVIALVAFGVSALQAMEVNIQPDKLRVKPGEPVKIRIKVQGLSAGTRAEVACRIENRISNLAAEFKGQTDKDGNAVFDFVPKEQWGYGISVTATADGKTAEAGEVFSCADNPYLVSPAYSLLSVFGQDFQTNGSPAPPGSRTAFSPYFRKSIDAEVRRCRALYCTVVEFMGLAFDSLTSIKPPVEYYFKAYHYNYSANTTRDAIDRLHENGIASVIYVNSCASGVAGTEFARKNPELLAYRPDGTPAGEFFTETEAVHKDYIANYPKSLERLRTDKDYRDKLCGGYPGFLNCGIDFEDPRMAKIAAEKILEGKEYFGYDGVRYDGHYIVPSGGDPLAPVADIYKWNGKPQKTGSEAEAMTVRNMRTACDLMRKSYPDFLIGLNFADYRNDARGDQILRSEIIKVLSPGIWILDEVAKGTDIPAHPDHNWKDFIKNMSEEADRVRESGNVLFAGWGGTLGQNSADLKQIKAVSWASGFSWIPPCDFQETAKTDVFAISCNYNRFCMRFGEFILNSSLKRMNPEAAAKLVQVESSGPLLWERFIYTLDAPEGKYVVMHLVNKPLEQGLTVDAVSPPPVKSIAVTLKDAVFGGGKPRLDKVSIMSPDNAIVNGKPVTASVPGGITIKVPELKMWSVIVLPIEK